MFIFRFFCKIIISKVLIDKNPRGAILEDSALKLLPLEEIVSTINGVWNLSRFHFVLGILFQGASKSPKLSFSGVYIQYIFQFKSS